MCNQHHYKQLFYPFLLKNSSNIEQTKNCYKGDVEMDIKQKDINIYKKNDET